MSMRLLPKKINIPLLKALPIAYCCALGIVMVFTLVFLYRNFYRTIAQVDTIAELERTVSRERLNKARWDAAIQYRLEKLSDTDTAVSTSTLPLITRDPFQPL